MKRCSAPFRALRRLAGDRSGVALVEFALLAPVFMALFIGVLQLGIYTQNYSAIRSLASDEARDIVVAYQQQDLYAPPDIATFESDFKGKAAVSPYNLDQNALTFTLTEITPSDVDGSRKFTMDIAYSPPTFISGARFSPITLDYSRPVYVVGS